MESGVSWGGGGENPFHILLFVKPFTPGRKSKRLRVNIKSRLGQQASIGHSAKSYISLINNWYNKYLPALIQRRPMENFPREVFMLEHSLSVIDGQIIAG